MNISLIKLAAPLLGCLLLASCASSPSGSGGQGNVTPPPPPPPPVTNYDTREYRNNYGLDLVKAIAAYDKDASGEGITVAVIDSGIDIDNSQIMANIHPDSTNIATGLKSDLNDVDGHGTGVAGVIASIRDPSNNTNVNTHGIAFNAQIMALNAASAGSCGTEDGCTFSDPHIAQALDYARLRGVKIVNISLGGDGFNSPSLVGAYQRAVDAGMIIILAAGNRDDEDTDLILSQPENSAAVAWSDWANGQIILAGGVDATSSFWDGSHKAGEIGKNVFLVAAAEDILSIGLPDENGDEQFFLWSGTSFAAPHIAGSAALLMEAFPNLTGKQVADLLFDTATDLGDVGPDVIYGRGLVNLEEAFAPQGTSSIAVKTAAGDSRIVAMDSSILLGGGAFGSFDGLSVAVADSLMLDGYNRSYRVDLGQRVYGRGENVSLDSMIASRRGSRSSSLQLDQSVKVKLSWQEDRRFSEVNEQYFAHQNPVKNQTRDLRMKLEMSLEAGRNMTFAQGLSLKEAMEDYDQDEFLTIGKEDFTALIGRNKSQSIIFGQKLNGKTRLDLIAGHGTQQWQQYNLKADNTIMMARLGHHLSPAIKLGFDLGVMSETGSILGSLSDGAVSLGKGASTLFAGARFDWGFADNMNFFTRASFGLTDVRSADLSLVQGIGSLQSASFSIGVTGNSLLQRGDRLSFAISQPLRVVGGHADISYVSARDYQNDSLSFISNRVSLSPDGREIDFELAYRAANILGAQVDFNILHQINPGHNRQSPDNTGFMIRFGSEF